MLRLPVFLLNSTFKTIEFHAKSHSFLRTNDNVAMGFNSRYGTSFPNSADGNGYFLKLGILLG